MSAMKFNQKHTGNYILDCRVYAEFTYEVKVERMLYTSDFLLHGMSVIRLKSTSNKYLSFFKA